MHKLFGKFNSFFMCEDVFKLKWYKLSKSINIKSLKLDWLCCYNFSYNNHNGIENFENFS